MSILDQFDNLVFATFPRLNATVGISRQRKATATVDTFTVSVTGTGIAGEVEAAGYSPEAAVTALKVNVAKARRAYDADQVLAGLRGEWNQDERSSLRQSLLAAFGRDAYQMKVNHILTQDQARQQAA